MLISSFGNLLSQESVQAPQLNKYPEILQIIEFHWTEKPRLILKIRDTQGDARQPEQN